MDKTELIHLLSTIKGCTFASLDAITYPSPGIRKETTNEVVILFANKHSSGYENRVRKRLAKLGKDPDLFRASNLPWGRREKDSPLIVHEDKLYLSTVLLKLGKYKYFIGQSEVNPKDLRLRERTQHAQYLPSNEIVVVSAYNIDNITRIRLLKEEYIAPEPGE